MVKEIVKDVEFLSKPCERVESVKDVKDLIQDIKDTCEFHKERCAGLCANQIGVNKCVIAVRNGNNFLIMVNPSIINHSDKTYVAEEGCMSLDYTKQVTRYHLVNVMYRTESGLPAVKEFRGAIAQYIQHEVDHTKGILI